MAHEFVIKRNKVLETYTSIDDIPNDIDTVIKFIPDVPAPPHTPEQHEEIDQWPAKLAELMKRCKY
tara:strand:+ start:1348 stop:1545 length:198 start_codon:yes stop_codon:yes gene_type:complete